MTIYAHRLFNADIEIPTERADKSAPTGVRIHLLFAINCHSDYFACHSERSEESLNKLLNKGAMPV
jgi:hypothetical protein